MKRKASTPDQKATGSKPKKKDDFNIFEDGPIIIKGSSVSLRYNRSSFKPRGDWNDHNDNGSGNQMTITQVLVMNDDTRRVLYQGSPGQNCTIQIDYK